MRIIFLFLAVILTNSNAAILHVPLDYTTIQAGINVSLDGDTVLVADGIYTENLILDKDITLASHFLLNGNLDHRDNTIIDGSAANDAAVYGSCITVKEPAENPIIIGFTIQNGKGSKVVEIIDTPDGQEQSHYKVGGGISFIRTYPRIQYNKFNFNGDGQTIREGGAIFGGIEIDFDETLITAHPAFTLTREDTLIFSHNIFDDNESQQAKSIMLKDYDNVLDIQNGYFDVFNCEDEIVPVYWVYSEGFDVNADYGDGEHCINADQTEYFVSPEGNDDINDGTEFFPYKTINKVFTLITPDLYNPVTIHLAEGTYSPSLTGEIFPIVLQSNVHIIGEGEEITILDAEQTGRVITVDYCENNTISNLSITGGLAITDNDNFGGGLFLLNSDSIINNVVIRNNAAGWRGGGICILYSNPIITNVIIQENLAESSGGIYLGYSYPGLYDIIIDTNIATVIAGGITLQDSDPIMRKIIISNNISDYMAGINLWHSNPKIIQMVIQNNIAVEGGGLTLTQNSNPIIINSIFRNNNPESILFVEQFFSNSINISNSNIGGGEEGIITNDNGEVHWLDGNIDADPLFTDPENGDYSLQPNSPCIDAGTPLFVLGGDTLVNMAPDEYYGSAPDMGAVEYNPLFIAEELPVLPVEFTLYPAYPNPFNPMTTISFSVPMVEKLSKTSLQVYDIKGKQVETLLNDAVAPGFYSIVWNAETIPSGIYFVKLSSGGFSKSQKLMLLK